MDQFKEIDHLVAWYKGRYVNRASYPAYRRRTPRLLQYHRELLLSMEKAYIVSKPDAYGMRRDAYRSLASTRRSKLWIYWVYAKSFDPGSELAGLHPDDDRCAQMPFDEYQVELFNKLQQREYQRLQQELHLDWEGPKPHEPMFQSLSEREQQFGQQEWLGWQQYQQKQQEFEQQWQVLQQQYHQYRQQLQQECQQHQQLPELQQLLASH